ncbi:Protein of unknown function [Paracoccus sanguinis]|uniref:DUF935 domain-containing protein n=1 Tax=Paracoccus sanguinis TaxID=1545044 RepID=A0A1H2SQ54_9RHOB|nr:Protein of unknown function [Paracoccus sanguinis]
MAKSRRSKGRGVPLAPVPSRQNLPAEARALIAGAHNDITIPLFSNRMRPQDEVLIQRGGSRGLKIYDDVERDPRAFAALQKRKKTLIARDWAVEPAGEDARDIEAAELVTDLLGQLPFDRICEDLLDATLKGYAVSEIVWGRDGSRIVPVDVVSHDPRRFTFGTDWRPRLLTMAAPLDGIDLPDRKFIVHRHGVKGNNPFGLGLGSRLFWPVLFKREGITFWLHFLEKFAAPTAIAQSPYGQLSEEQNRLLNTLLDIRGSSAVVVPVGTDVKFLEAARSGAVTYADFLAYWDKEIAICVTGETLTTDIGSNGSRAASETHAEILELLVDSDADLLSSTLRQSLVAWIVDYNLPGARVPHVWRARPENELETAKVGQAKADTAKARAAAMRDALSFLVNVADDTIALELLPHLAPVEGMSEAALRKLVEGRAAFKSVPVAAPMPEPGPRTEPDSPPGEGQP